MKRKRYETAAFEPPAANHLEIETPESPKQPPAATAESSPRATVSASFYCAACDLALVRNSNRMGPYLVHPPGPCAHAGKLFEMPSVKLQEVASR